ncbi:hypothetical protein K443DRAFT_671656 [Laccaria amethystina LaAM-08-1]|uniref:peptidylprolyl isomerase n=1 Tax=Laccaria amethystina LaAM-08-1 TaxID=1095629 RepID=A0A0C9YMG6_9AGAR|nr:hypothetical protein K443DRAFT_671656 [Laccaria amethystina LaAM-08-1]
MSIAIGLWSLALQSGKPEPVIPQADVRITNVALGEELKDVTGRTVIKFSFENPIQMDDEDEDEEEPTPAISTTVLCSLTAGKIEQATTDIVLEKEEEYLFEAVGKNTVYLTGNYIDQPLNQPPFDDDSDEDLDDEDAYDLREVSSDVEMNPEDIDGLESDASRFEEVKEEEATKPQKRPRESDAVDVEVPKLSKAEKKNKKQKAEGGVAVPTGEESNEKKEEKKKEKKEKKVGDEPKTKELPGGIKIKDSKVGTGPQAKKGNTVLMRYIGKLQNGKIFDKNVKGKPFTFHLGQGEVIKGWDEGIVGMQVGGERVLTIPPAMAYGKKASGAIPANSTLTFEVKLMEIK